MTVEVPTPLLQETNTYSPQETLQKHLCEEPEQLLHDELIVPRSRWVRLMQTSAPGTSAASALYFGRRFKLGRTLGEGEFGKVKHAYSVLTFDESLLTPAGSVSPSSVASLTGDGEVLGGEVAIKFVKKSILSSDNRREKLVKEIAIMQQLPAHPNIIRLIEVLESEKYIGLVLEYAQGGELFNHILAKKHLSERESRKCFQQLVDGVLFLHEQRIVHRDLKLENLLLDSQGNIKITDFGFANNYTDKQLMKTSCGSPCYASPELVLSDSYDGPLADSWSCGVILYAMLCGYLPFDDDPLNPESANVNLLYKYILKTDLRFPSWVGESARDLVRCLLKPDPAYRLPLDRSIYHRWYALSVHNVSRMLRASNNTSSSGSVGKMSAVSAGRNRAVSDPPACPPMPPRASTVMHHKSRESTPGKQQQPYRFRFGSFGPGGGKRPNMQQHDTIVEENAENDENRPYSVNNIPVRNRISRSGTLASIVSTLSNFHMKTTRSMSTNAESAPSFTGDDMSFNHLRVFRGPIDPKLVSAVHLPVKMIEIALECLTAWQYKIEAADDSCESIKICRTGATSLECTCTIKLTPAPVAKPNDQEIEATESTESVNTSDLQEQVGRGRSNSLLNSLKTSIQSSSFINNLLSMKLHSSGQAQSSTSSRLKALLSPNSDSTKIKLAISVCKVGDLQGVFCMDIKRIKGPHRHFKAIYTKLVDEIIQF